MDISTGHISTIAKDTPRAFKVAAVFFLCGTTALRFSSRKELRFWAKCRPIWCEAETFPVQVDFIGAFPEHTTSLRLQIGPTKPALPVDALGAAWH